MGFFAVASSDGNEAPVVNRCHLNIWTLGGLLGYRVCYLDVGLQLTAGEEPLRTFRLGLPVCTPPEVGLALESLSRRMEDPTVAGLIFAREDPVHNGEITLRDGPVPLLDIDRSRCEMAERPRAKHFSLWTLRLTNDLPAGDSGYLRVRFHVHGGGRMWIWQRSLLARNRAIVDCRVNDEREALAVVDGSEFTGRMLPLEDLNVFVIAPAAFTPSVTTPEPRYVRPLEGRIWEEYLGRRTDLGRDEKFLIYHWHNNRPTTRQDPFRAFLQLERRRSLLPSWSDLMPVLLALLLAIVLLDVSFRDFGWAADVGGFLAGGFPLVAGLGGLLALFMFFAHTRDRLREFVTWLRSVGRRLDKYVYSMRISDD